MRILIGYDGSVRADAAVDELRYAGLGDDVQAEVVFVAEVWAPPEDAATGSSVWDIAIRNVATQGGNTLANASRVVEQGAGRLRARLPAWRVTGLTETGPAAVRLVERAERWPADLLVVGAQGHAVVERLGVGSVALKVLTHVGCPVRVARAFHGREGRVRVAVGVDGSADAERAVDAVAGRAWPAGTEARVFTVVDHRVLSVPPGMELMPGGGTASAASEAVADAATARLRHAGLAASCVVLLGDPKHVLVDAARDWAADCIFVGARGLTRVERFLLGSVSTSVALHAACSVEVVHPRAA
jgi:nucleotide-binding universal stress UspA family protein